MFLLCWFCSPWALWAHGIAHWELIPFPTRDTPGELVSRRKWLNVVGAGGLWCLHTGGGCPSASLHMHVWVSTAAGGLQRRGGPKIGGKKAWGTSQPMLLRTIIQPRVVKPIRLCISSLPHCRSSWAPFRPQLSKESKVSAQAASHTDSHITHGSIAHRPIERTERGHGQHGGAGWGCADSGFPVLLWGEAAWAARFDYIKL